MVVPVEDEMEKVRGDHRSSQKAEVDIQVAGSVDLGYVGFGGGRRMDGRVRRLHPCVQAGEAPI